MAHPISFVWRSDWYNHIDHSSMHPTRIIQLGLSTSPSVDHLYSNLWVWSAWGCHLDPNGFRRQITWPTDDYLQVTCVYLHMPKPPQWPHTPARKDTSSTIPADALSASAVSTMPVITACHPHTICMPSARREGGQHIEIVGRT